MSERKGKTVPEMLELGEVELYDPDTHGPFERPRILDKDGNEVIVTVVSRWSLTNPGTDA